MRRNLLVVIFLFLLFSNERYVQIVFLITEKDHKNLNQLNIDQFSKEFDANKYYRVNGEGECKDVTVGDCELKADQIVFSSIISDAGLCQFFCNTLTDCNVFQFHEAEQNCTLLKEDYHQDCLSSSGPEVRNIVKEVSTYQKVKISL